MPYTAAFTEERDVKTFQAKCGEAINPYVILCKGTDADEVKMADDGSVWPVGVAGNCSENPTETTYADHDPITVKYSGIAYVKLGGTISRDDAVIAGASGVGVAIGNNTEVFVFGHAMRAGVTDDIIPVMIQRYYVSADMQTI